MEKQRDEMEGMGFSGELAELDCFDGIHTEMNKAKSCAGPQVDGWWAIV